MKDNIKNYNYKIVVGIIFGILISGIGVAAATKYGSNTVFYDNSNSTLSSGDVQGAIDELASRYVSSSSCPKGYICNKVPFSLGDYVKITPTKSSYTVDTSKTGSRESAETINPQELNLWRVIKINDDGSADVVSENVSSTSVYFYGKTGYQNLVGYLNVLASQYENSAYTKGSRNFGYNGQTEYITDMSKFTTTSPWDCNTGGDCNPDESLGGGDLLYKSDFELIEKVLGTYLASEPGSTRKSYYWLSSREYMRYSSSEYQCYAIRASNSTSSKTTAYEIYGHSSSFKEYGTSASIRPILTLKSGLKYTGSGTADDPLKPVSESANVKVGDYISMTPTKSSYTTDTSKTGYSSTQTINPKELNLWRVIKLNSDGTVDVISSDVSSTQIYFSGQTGYQNLVGYLNTLASQYENSTYTKGSRHFGYDSQTENITDTSKFTRTAPWTCSTGSSCSTTESQGGGDELYDKDYNLVNNALGSTSASSNYWMASRYYNYSSNYSFGWNGRFISSSGSLSNSALYSYRYFSFSSSGVSGALRPILTLKSGLKYTGSGTKDAPLKLSAS